MNNLDFSFLAKWRTSGWVVHGTTDQLVPEDMVKELVARPCASGVSADYVPVTGASHFFGAEQEELVRLVRERITRGAKQVSASSLNSE